MTVLRVTLPDEHSDRSLGYGRGIERSQRSTMPEPTVELVG